jgi:hypothetical protein
VIGRSQLLALAAVLLAVATSCTETRTGPAIALPEFETLRTSAIEAVARPGEVFHTTMSFTQEGSTYVQEAWVYADQDLARIEYGIEGDEVRLEIYHDGKRAELSPSDRLQDVEFPAPGWSGGKVSMEALDYLEAIAESDVVVREIRADDVNSVAAIVVETEQPYEGDGYEGTTKNELYLDESFLPLRWHVERDVLGVDIMASFENEFVTPESLPADFFSPESVRELEVLPADRIAEALEAGIEPYWLGDQFEEISLQDARVDEAEGGIMILHLTYGYEGRSGEDPPFGVTISEFTVEGWEGWFERSANAWWRSDSETLTTKKVDVLGESSTLYEDPNAGRPSIDAPPPPGEEGPTPSTPVPEWAASALVVQLGETVLLIESNVGPRYGNPYVPGQGLVRVANALQAFAPE